MPASGRHIPTAKLSRGTPGLRDSATGGFAYGAITLSAEAKAEKNEYKKGVNG